MARPLPKVMVVFPGTLVGYLVPPFLVKVPLPINLVFHVGLEHPPPAVLLVLALVHREVSHLPAGRLVSPRLLADLRKATKAIHLSPATDLRRHRLVLPLLLRVLPYPWIPLSYPVHLRWNKSRCSAR